MGTHTNPLAYAVSLLMKGILTIYYHIFYYLMSHLYYLMGAYDIFCTTVFPNCNIVRLFNSHSLMGWVTFSILCMQCTINSGANSLEAVLLPFVLENVMWCDPRHWKYFISVLEKKEERYILDVTTVRGEFKFEFYTS